MSNPRAPFEAPSFERSEQEKIEAFLNRDSLQSLNSTLGELFAFVDKMGFKKVLEKGEIAEVKENIEYLRENPQPGVVLPCPDTLREFRAQSMFGLYSPHVLANLLVQDAKDDNRDKLYPEEEQQLADYTMMHTIFTKHPELRVRLLKKMIVPFNDRHVRGGGRCEPFGRFLYEFYGTEPKKDGVEEYFLSLDGQADLFESWNGLGERYGGNWGFTAEQFAEIRKQIPEIRERAKEYADKPFVASVLVPRLPGRPEEDGVGRTFRTLIQIGESLRKRPIGNNVLGINTYTLELNTGRTYIPGLSLGLVNMQGNVEGDGSLRGSSDFRGLSTFALNPKWTQAIRDRKAFSTFLTGLAVRTSENIPGAQTYYLDTIMVGAGRVYRDRDRRQTEQGDEYMYRALGNFSDDRGRLIAVAEDIE